MGLRYDEISEILKLIDSSSCDEFVLETDDIRLIVRRHGADGFALPLQGDQRAQGFPPPQSSTTPASEPKRSAPASGVDASYGGAHVVRAPMVGTFYRSPSPGAPSFVELGTKVKTGDPICIIEVMKLFTTIHAECSGAVTEIGAENAQLVEYGQMLFVIAPE